MLNLLLIFLKVQKNVSFISIQYLCVALKMSLQVKCTRCGKTWSYSGASEYYASCPNCKTSVNLRKALQLNEGELKIKSSLIGGD